jgi:hypothetical protein
VKQEKLQVEYGVMAEFDSPEGLVRAAKSVYEAGYRKIDAFTPYPIEEVSELIGFHRHHNKVPLITLIGGLLGGFGGYMLAYSASAVWYPLNVAGRPYQPWPMFIPVTFECTVLVAGLTCAIGMLLKNGLPRPNHPVFSVPSFDLASNNRFFLLVESEDPIYNGDTATFLKGLNALDVVEVDGERD